MMDLSKNFSPDELQVMLLICLFVLFFCIGLTLILLFRNRKLSSRTRKMAYHIFGLKEELQQEHARYLSKSERIDRLKLDLENLAGHLNALAPLFEQMPFPVWRREANGTISLANLAYLRITGDDKITGKEHQPIRELHRDISLLMQDKQQQKNSMATYVIVDGDRRFFEITEMRLADGSVLGFAIDRTEYNEKRRELEELTSMQSDVMSSARSGMAMFGADARLQFYNQAYAKLWNMQEEWLAQMPSYGEVLEYLREKRLLPEQANFSNFKKDQLALFQNLLKKKEEYIYLPDGSVIQMTIIPHQQGGLLFIYDDLTEKIMLERSYNEAISVKRSTLDNLQEGLVVFGQDGKLQLCNPVFTEIWNLPSNCDEKQQHIADVIEETKPFFEMSDDWEAYKEQMVSSIMSRKKIRQKIERADGSIIDMSTVPLPDGATLVTYNDVTASERLQQSLRAEKQALEEADDLKNKFMANVSYELRSPLTSIQGFAEVLQQEYFGKLNQKQQEYVQDIYDSCQQLNRLVNNVLDVTSIDAGFFELQMQPVGVEELVTPLFAEAEKLATKKGIGWQVEIDAKNAVIEADAEKLRQVFFNLIENAIIHTNEGEVKLHIAQANGQLRVKIIDTGCGISSDEQEEVFQKFYKSSNNTMPGTGLGLTAARHIVELHQGALLLDSEMGKGTTITCHFKLVE